MSAAPGWEEVTRLVVGNSIILGGNRVVVGGVRTLRQGKGGYGNARDIVLSGVMNGSVTVEIRFRDAPEVPCVEFTE